MPCRLLVHERGVSLISSELRQFVGPRSRRLQSGDPRRLVQRECPLAFLGRHALGDQSVHLGDHLGLESLSTHPRPSRHVTDQQVAALGEVECVGAGVGRDLQLAHEALGQATAFAQAEHCAKHAGRVPLTLPGRRHAEREKEPRRDHRIGDDLASPRAERRRHRHVAQRRAPAPARDRTEVTLDHRACRLRVEVAGEREYRVVGRVVGAEEVGHIVEARRAQVLHRPDQRVVERMLAREAERRQPLPPGAVRLIVYRPATLVLHHVALRVELLLCHRREEPRHAVRFEPERELQLMRRHRLVVVGPIEPGRTIERATGALHEFEVLVGADLRAPLKEHVLEQVRESRASGAFVRRAHVVPQVHCHDRRRMVLRQHHTQSVGQRVRLDRDPHLPPHSV